MFTTAQANELGVSNMDVSRLAKNGHIEQVIRGVYRAAAAPSPREERVYAVWLSLDPATPAFARARDESEFTASCNTAAWLLELGELNAEPLTFSFPNRRQTRSKGIRFLKRELSKTDITAIAGIPVTTPRRTVLDLLDVHEDISLVLQCKRMPRRQDYVETSPTR